MAKSGRIEDGNAEQLAEEEAKKRDPAADVRNWLLEARHGTLSTLSTRSGMEGFPMGSLTPFALTPQGRPFILTARIAAHTKNLRADPRASLFVKEPKVDAPGKQADPQATWRATLMGRFIPLRKASDDRAEIVGAKATVLEDGAWDEIHARYCERVPDAPKYLSTHDFDYWVMQEIETVRYIAGFGRICWVQGAAIVRDQSAFKSETIGAVSHMNADHAEALKDIASAFCEHPCAKVELLTIDAAGLLMQAKAPDALLHVSFPHEITQETLRAEVVALAKQARTVLNANG